MKCNQENCQNPPAFKFTWPGKDEDFICAIHTVKLASIAQAMGLHLQTRPLSISDIVGSP